MISTASAAAHPNIAFIKYWGNRDQELRLPVSGSLSMNLYPLETRTTVSFDTDMDTDQLILNGEPGDEYACKRVSGLLDHVRKLGEVDTFALVVSQNNFPTGAGIASSASAYAALALAAVTALGLCQEEDELSRLARTGSGSACRSIPGGFVEWQPGEDHETSFAFSIAGQEHWDLVDLVAVISQEHKSVGSTEGHQLAASSPIQKARVADADRRLAICRQAILSKDFMAFAEVVEQDSNLMHSVMMTSQPPLYYWLPGTLEVMEAVQVWRQEGTPVCFTIDAGPNPHLICLRESADRVRRGLGSLGVVKSILECSPGGPARVLEPEIGEV
jgi:diphosphomevalonate decarboxylase